MSRVAYFEELSADDDSISSSSSDADDETFDEAMNASFVLHADVDCFYCQCEQVDHPELGDRPLAIGQKHIIVTSNYTARERGVGKLMLREEAYRRCPNLLIVEGSDLERYRIHSRTIYESFRKACKELFPEVSVAKGSMDEMMAGIPRPGEGGACAHHRTSYEDDDRIYIYGEGPSHEQIELVEDQTGATTIVGVSNAPRHHTAAPSGALRKLLLEPATVALQVRQRIHDETGFTTTMGLSINPLLAKLASGLRKPAFVNLLVPGEGCQRLVSGMPLRKITGVGRGAMKLLVPCLEKSHGKKVKGSPPWTCGDLLRLSRLDVKRCFSQSAGSVMNTDTVFDLCRGVDDSSVEDDEGGIPKTLSVENSFRRGTIKSEEKVLAQMEDLHLRLPRLLQNRTSWSTNPELAFPTVIRLTVRLVDHTVGEERRRPFATTSAQCPFDGKAMLAAGKLDDGSSKQSDLLRQAIAPLLQKQIFSRSDVNLTRVNVALSGFMDVPGQVGSHKPSYMTSVSKRRRIDDFFSPSQKEA